MKFKQLAIVLGIFVLLFVVLLSTQKSDDIHLGTLKPGDLLFPQWEEVQSIEVSRDNKSTVIEKEDEMWLVKNRHDFTADQKFVSDVLQGLQKLKVAQSVDARPEDLKFYALDANSEAILEKPIAVKVNFKDGKNKLIYLGKTHTSGKEKKGRYYQDEDSKDIFISTQTLSNVSEDPRVWLRKFLPSYERIVSVSFFSSSRLHWQTGRNSLSKPFKFRYPSELAKLNEAQVHQFMSQVFMVRYLDVDVARPVAKRDFNGDRLEIVDNVGRTYSLEPLALRKEGGGVRCRLSLNVDADVNAGSDYMDIQQTLSEWHFIVPSRLFQVMKLQQK